MRRSVSVENLADQIRALYERGGCTRCIVGIVGAPGSGKSTLSSALQKLLGCAVIPMDGYHLSNKVLEANGSRTRKGAHDTFDSRGFASLLRRVVDDAGVHPVYYPVFHRDIEESVAAEAFVDANTGIVLVEGLYLLLPAWGLQDIFAETWYLDVDDAERRKRLVDRRLALGYSREEAEQWAMGSDEVNAQLVATTKGHATRLINVSCVL